MFYALTWFFVLALLALWSLAAWALHGMAVWAVSQAGTLGTGPAGAGTIGLPDSLAPWVPPELAQWVGQVLAGLGPLVDGLLQAAPALAGGVTVAAWIVWGIGSVLLLLLGAGLHGLIALWRRRAADGSATGSDRRLAAG